jgi:hypothetical protein
MSSHTFIAQQVVGNNVHELTYSGAHVKCKAYCNTPGVTLTKKIIMSSYALALTCLIHLECIH